MTVKTYQLGVEGQSCNLAVLHNPRMNCYHGLIFNSLLHTDDKNTSTVYNSWSGSDRKSMCCVVFFRNTFDIVIYLTIHVWCSRRCPGTPMPSLSVGCRLACGFDLLHHTHSSFISDRTMGALTQQHFTTMTDTKESLTAPESVASLPCFWLRCQSLVSAPLYPRSCSYTLTPPSSTQRRGSCRKWDSIRKTFQCYRIKCVVRLKWIFQVLPLGGATADV